MTDIRFPIGTRLLVFTCPIENGSIDWDNLTINVDAPADMSVPAVNFVIVSNVENIEKCGDDFVVSKPLIALRDTITMRNRQYIFGYALAYDREEVREMLKSYNYKGG